MRTVLVTGATGCVGHHVVEALVESGRYRVRALVRDPGRFRRPPPPGQVDVVVGDVADLARDAGHHADVDAIVHLAAAWGEMIAYPVNVDATLALARLGKPMVYFSTASILDAQGALMPEAITLGTDYVRSKAYAYAGIRALPDRSHVQVVFPTLVVGGDARHPASHLGRSLAELHRWLWALRWLTLDGSFHLIHAHDLARMALHLLDAPPAGGMDLVAGNPALTVREAIAELLAIAGRRPPGPALDLTPLAPLVAGLVGDRMSSWDRFCLRQRHFTYAAVNPRALGLAPGIETLAEAFAHEGWRAGHASEA